MNFLCVVVLLIAGATAQGGKCFPLPCRLPGGQVPLCGIPLNPNDTISLQFTPVFRADNVTLQNTNITLPIKQGRSIFLLPSVIT
ncbi:hypothetical protein QTP86_011234 [Hemibagrus guttatus]|nr:hypothetical protein QTP86_011234 [Hemibagrus guttatus]